MEPLIFHPSWSRQKLFDEAVKRVPEMCKAFNVPLPRIYDHVPAQWQERHHRYASSVHGLYTNNKIYVQVSTATTPAKSRCRNWSYPGYKVDRTASGIVAHELGHHCQFAKRLNNSDWARIVRQTQPVTGYEPNNDESWAESFRIFVWNPQLLKLARPIRYEFISHYFKPLHNLRWQEVLVNAPDFIKEYAAKFVNA